MEIKVTTYTLHVYVKAVHRMLLHNVHSYVCDRIHENVHSSLHIQIFKFKVL